MNFLRGEMPHYSSKPFDFGVDPVDDTDPGIFDGICMHWSVSTPLAADTKAHRVQDRSADLKSHEWYGTAISGTICPCRRPALPTGFALCSHQSSYSRTNYRKKSPLRHLYLPSNVTSRHF